MDNRRDFLKKTALAGTALVAGGGLLESCKRGDSVRAGNSVGSSKLIVPKAAGVPITGTFLDEISHDIPHQNWGEAEWDRDFAYMKAVGIRDVIVIRCGYRKFLTYPSPYLLKKGCYMPSVDLVDMFCRLSDKYGMKFWFGLYDSGVRYPDGAAEDMENNKFVIEEAWEMYGRKYKSFSGWYLSKEFSRRRMGMIDAYHALGRQCKDISGGHPTFISPFIDGKKQVYKEKEVTVVEHERDWDEIFSGIHDVVDACAFQDGHVDYDELDMYLTVNKRLADKYGMQSWTNAETFDRDMPIRFLPIKFDKLRFKLEAAKRCGYDKAITFEFSHFMSPQSAYLQAGHLYDRYCEYFGI
ncbi:MAG: DUF4434 domain-containing protein [Bacteroidales bacterium]|nr:DUF4434 domain-containing protein [Bacteroidales bacterium]